MAIQYLSGNRATGTESDRTGMTTYSAKSWVELGRTTLTSTGSTIAVEGITTTDYDHLMILSHNLVNSDHNMTYSTGNGSYPSSGNNYCDRRSENGGSDATTTNRSDNGIISDAHTKEMFTVGDMANYDGKEKFVIWHSVGHNADGEGNAPDRFECVGKFTGTSKIDRLKLNNSSSINNEIGSEMIILGAKSSGTDNSQGFWQELADVELTSTANEIDSGTFTAKKYLWVQLHGVASGSISGSDLQFNGDTGSNYARRYSANGGSDGTGTSEATLGGIGTASGDSFVNWFIINKSDKEKLAISSGLANTTGASNAPDRREIVGKWDNKSDSITSIKVKENGSGGWTNGTTLKVWGSD
jgi:hypothetical protein